MALEVRKLRGLFGCEVVADLNALTRADQTQFRELYQQHYLILARGQSLSHEDQARITGYLGPVLTSHDALNYISNVRADGQLGDSALAFHSDLAYAPYPDLGLSLHAVDVVDDASSTLFASSVAGCQGLPGSLRKRIRNLEVVHVSAGRNMSGRPPKDLPADWPQTVRPMLISHPMTGDKILYVTINQTLRVIGLSASDSDALLEELFAYLYLKDKLLTHYWRVGDILLWDNLALQHSRGEITDVGNRTLQRAVIGEKSFFEQYPHLSDAYATKSGD